MEGPEGFHVAVDGRGPLPVVRVTGELDNATAPALRRALIDVIGDNPGRRIVLDLAGMSFIDSTGLGVLVGGLKRARNQAGDLLLAGLSSTTTKVMELTGLDAVFEVVDGTPAAPEPGASFAHN